MYDPNSPILDFYSLDFNGKKQDWEAIVKIPFIDEKRLKAMASREHRLTEADKQRNGFGTSTRFSYNSGEPTQYPSSLPGFFPPLYRCTCIMEPFDLPTLNCLHLVPGLCDGVLTGAEALAGFPQSTLFLISPSSDSMVSMYMDPRVETNRWWCISRTLTRIARLRTSLKR